MSWETDDYARYTVKGWPAVAVYVRGWERVWQPETVLLEDDEGNEYQQEAEWGEWVDDIDSGMVRVVMVGDDREHIVDAGDLVPIPDDEYCSCCGQVGCNWS